MWYSCDECDEVFDKPRWVPTYAGAATGHPDNRDEDEWEAGCPKCPSDDVTEIPDYEPDGDDMVEHEDIGRWIGEDDDGTRRL